MTRSTTRIATVIAAAVLLTAAVFGLARNASDPWADLVAATRAAPPGTLAGRFAAIELTEAPSWWSRWSRAEDDPMLAAFAVAKTSGDAHRRAVANALLGRHSEAADLLRALTESAPSAAVWNDLAVTLASSEQSARADVLIEALAATDRAVDLDPAFPLVRFNRARIIETLGLRRLARRAYEDHQRLDASSAAGMEGRQRLAALQAGEPGRGLRSRTAELLAAARRQDAATIERIVAGSPHEARTLAMSDMLPSWGEATLRRADGEEAAPLIVARVIGNVLRQRNDTIVAEAIAAIDASANNPRRRSTLAAGHAAYGRAAALYGRRQVTNAAPLFEDARSQFVRGGSPLSAWAAYYCASAAVDTGAPKEALRMLDDLAPAAREYAALAPQLDRLRGTIYAFDGFTADALTLYRRAETSFLSLGETTNAIDASARAAAALVELGRTGESWALHRGTIARAGALDHSRVVQLAVYSAMFAAIEENRWPLAHALVNLLAGIDDANPRIHADALIWRALTARRAGVNRLATAHFEEAAKAVRSIEDLQFRESAENDLGLVRALLIAPSSPEEAARLFTKSLEAAQDEQRQWRVPQMLALRARAFRAMGRSAEEEADLRRAVQIIDSRTGRVDDDLLRDTFLGKASSVHARLAEFLDRNGDSREAIELLDRRRAGLYADRRGLEWPVVAGSTVIVNVSVFEDRAVTYVIRGSAVERFPLEVAAATLESMANAFVESVRNDEIEDVRTRGRRLYDVVLRDAMRSVGRAQKIIFVADAPLDRVPMAALVQPTGRFLVEDYRIASAPAVGACSGVADEGATKRHLAAIGDPAFDLRMHPSFARLPGAEEEVRRAAPMYAASTVLTGASASRANVLSALRRANVAHIAAHGVVDGASPERSRILLANEDVLTAEEIAGLRLANLELIVLAGCRTASARVAHGFVQNLASAFQVAGARNVIGTLWDVDDAATRDVSITLHQALSRGVAPHDALREAQLSVMQGPSSSWAALQLYEVR